LKTSSPGLRLYVLRHGEPARRDVFYGFHDIDLSERGLEQARAQAERLGGIPFTAIYSSDLCRARRGAELIAERGSAKVRIEPDLREMSLGALEGMPHAEAMERFPEWAARSYFDMLDARMPQGGESVRDLATRVLAAMERMAEAHAQPATAGRPWPTVLIYAHNTVARVLLAEAAGVGVVGYPRFEQRYGAINRVDVPVEAQRLRWEEATIAYTNRDPLASTRSGR